MSNMWWWSNIEHEWTWMAYPYALTYHKKFSKSNGSPWRLKIFKKKKKNLKCLSVIQYEQWWKKVKVIWAKTRKKLPKILHGDCHWPALMKKFKVQNWKTRKKLLKWKPKWYAMKYEPSQNKKKFFFFQNDLKYFQFTIEVNGKNWYIEVYHA